MRYIHVLCFEKTAIRETPNSNKVHSSESNPMHSFSHETQVPLLLTIKRVINRLVSIKIIVGIFSDVDVQKPDEKSIMTYIAQFLKAYPEMGSDKPMVSLSSNPPTLLTLLTLLTPLTSPTFQ